MDDLIPYEGERVAVSNPSILRNATLDYDSYVK